MGVPPNVKFNFESLFCAVPGKFDEDTYESNSRTDTVPEVIANSCMVIPQSYLICSSMLHLWDASQHVPEENHPVL